MFQAPESTVEPIPASAPTQSDPGPAPIPIETAAPSSLMVAAPAEADGPRERLASLGARALSNSELLAVLLGTGSAGKSVFEIARELSAFGLKSLAHTPAIALARRQGLGPAKALRVLAAFELGKRLHCDESPARPRLDAPDVVAAYLTPRHAAYPNEVFGLLALDSRHKLLGETIVASGGRHSVAVAPADVFQAALPFRPRSIVAFHNHPGGDPHPSEEDKALTYRLARAGEVLGIALVDHIVLGGQAFASFKLLGLL